MTGRVVLLPGCYPSMADCLGSFGIGVDTASRFWRTPDRGELASEIAKLAGPGREITLVIPHARHYSLSVRRAYPAAIMGEILSRALRVVEIASRLATMGITVRLIYLSSFSVYDQAVMFPSFESDIAGAPAPLCPVGQAYLAAERLLIYSGHNQNIWPIIFRPVGIHDRREVSALRRRTSLTCDDPFFSTSPFWVDLTRRLVAGGGSGKFAILGGGEDHRELVHINDVARAVALATSAGPRTSVFNLGPGRSFALCEWVSDLSQGLYGFDPDFVHRMDHPYESARIVSLHCHEAAFVLGWQPAIGIDEIGSELIDEMLRR